MNRSEIITEIYTGVLTFMASAYIVMVHPPLIAEAGIPISTAFYATIAMILITTLMNAVLTRQPMIIGPAMVLNTFFTVTLVAQGHFPLPEALGIVAASGFGLICAALLNLTGWVNALCEPRYLMSFMYGIALLMLRFSLSMGHVTQLAGWETLWFLSCVIALYLVDQKKIAGGTLFIFLLFIVGYRLEHPDFEWVKLSHDWHGMQVSLGGLQHGTGILSCISLMFLNIFDTTATVAALSTMLQLKRHLNDRLMRTTLGVVGFGTMVGAFLGTSSVNPYLESTVAIHHGSRCALSSVVTAILFGLSIFMLPLLGIIPSVLSAAMLAFVALSICKNLWSFLLEANTYDRMILLLPIFGIPITSTVAYPVLLTLVILMITKD